MWKRMWYRLKKWVVQRWAPQFEPKIPQQLLNLGKPWKVDLLYMRYCGEVLTVGQVDEMLDAGLPKSQDGNIVTRMALKNMLVEYKLMDPAITDVNIRREMNGYWQSRHTLPVKMFKGGWSLQAKKPPKVWRLEWLVWRGRVRRAIRKFWRWRNEPEVVDYLHKSGKAGGEK